MDVRRTLSGLGFARPTADSPRRAANSGVRVRKIEPALERHLPPEAGTARTTPVFGYFRRHRVTILSYAFIVVASVAIAGISYTTYAFSRYQGVILSGVYVDSVPLGDQTILQAQATILQRLAAIHGIPVEFTYRGRVWKPTVADLKLQPDVVSTATNAYSIGRSGNFWRNLIDRMPIARHFSVTLIAPYKHKAAEVWVERTLVQNIHQPMANAGLVVNGALVRVTPSRDGYRVDSPAALRDIQNSVGSLTLHRYPVPLDYLHPAISDSAAAAIGARVNAFLAHPPILQIGTKPVRTDATQLASMLTFSPRVTSSSATIVMNINTTALNSYVDGLKSGYDVAAVAPTFTFSAGTVTAVAPRRIGRSMAGSVAYSGLLKDLKLLRPSQTIKVPVRKIFPPPDKSNPASLGISTLLGEGETSFAGSAAIRASDISAIASRLNGDLINPHQSISFNFLTGIGWAPRVYQDAERRVGGKFVPGSGGAMQQVATTFFRAAYSTGLPLLERHPHPYTLAWYQPPAGMDATVSPNGNDLRFSNTTGGYLYIETRIEPVQQALYIYIYGRKTGWNVTVSNPILGRTYSPGPPIVQRDPNVPAGTARYQQFSHQGADYVVTRTVTIPASGSQPARTVTDTLSTHYQPWRAIIVEGEKTARKPTPTPIPSPTATKPPPTPTPTPVG